MSSSFEYEKYASLEDLMKDLYTLQKFETQQSKSEPSNSLQTKPGVCNYVFENAGYGIITTIPILIGLGYMAYRLLSHHN